MCAPNGPTVAGLRGSSRALALRSRTHIILVFQTIKVISGTSFGGALRFIKVFGEEICMPERKVTERLQPFEPGTPKEIAGLPLLQGLRRGQKDNTCSECPLQALHTGHFLYVCVERNASPASSVLLSNCRQFFYFPHH